MLYIICNVFLYTVVVFLVNGKINEWMNDWMSMAQNLETRGFRNPESMSARFPILNTSLVGYPWAMARNHFDLWQLTLIL